MGELSKNFIAQFHNLPGDTVKEKHQNLFRLFHDNYVQLSGSQEDLEFVTANLDATCHLERIFRIDFLIHFRRFKELYKEFQNGDEIASSKLAKQDWFFRDVFKDLGAEEFVNDVLPTMSYAVKMKILKKLPLSEEQSDEIVDALCKRYGIFLATILLAKCSVNKIRETLENQPVKLSPPQLKLIYDRDPDLVFLYLEQRSKHDGNVTFMNENPFFVYLAQKNPDMFSKLFEKYKFQIHLGTRTTKRYIDLQKKIILAEPKPYINILKNEPLVRKLGCDLKSLLFEDNPKTSGLYWNCLLKYYPEKHRFDVYKSTYNKIYNHKFGDNIDVISRDVLKMIPDPVEREKYAKLKFQKEENEDYLKYVTASYCLEEYMEKLDQMNVSERAKFVEVATECCLLNGDMDSLLKICELVAVRFKNDDRKIRESFLVPLGDFKHFKKFNEHHWKYIMDVLAVVKVQNEWIYNEYSLRLKGLSFLINNNKPVQDIIGKYSDWTDILEYDSTWKDLKLVKKFFFELMAVGCTKASTENDAFFYDCKLAYMCKRYNEKNSEDHINILDYPRIVESVKNVLMEDFSDWIYSEHTKGIEYIICQKDTSKELKQLYFKSLKTTGRLSACLWFLKHEPKTFQENFDHFLSNFSEDSKFNNEKLWRLIKKCSHLGLDKKTVDFCTTKLKEEGFSRKEDLVKAISIISPPTAHLELMKSYVPFSAKVDLSDTETKDLYSLQCELVKFLHFVDSPAAVLPMTLQFCKGDYLKFALRPLYSCIYKLPENQTKVFIEKINEDKAVSVKKHAMYLSCVIYGKQTAYNTLKNATVPSLVPALKYFSKNPSAVFWELFTSKLSNLEKKEVQVLKATMQVFIPFEYKHEYLKAVWAVLDKYDNKQLKKNLIQRIDENFIDKLEPQLVYTIIEDSIFKWDEANDFISRLLIYVNDDGKFEYFSKILTRFKENWKVRETRSCRRKLHTFVESFYKTYLDLECSNQQFVDRILAIFKSVFHVSEAFEEIIMVSFMKFKKETPENCGKFLVELANDLVKDYGKYVLSLLADTVNNHIIPHLFKTQKDKIEFCYAVYKCKKSVDDYLLIIKLLPKSTTEFKEVFKLYNEILSELYEVDDDCVRLEFNLYLKSKSDDSTELIDFEPFLASRRGICICPPRLS